jgi:hypothetical protein
MTTHTYAPLFGRRIRVTQLSGGGSPTGLNYMVTKGFMSVSLTAETEDGAEIIQRNANNELCINEKLSNTFKRLTASVRFCGVNPTLLSWMSNAEVYEDYAGDEAGFTLSEGPIEGQFALELFTGLAGSLGDLNAGGYALMPYLTKGTLADLEFNGEDAVDFTVENMMSASGNAWGTGPYDVVMNDAATPVASPLPTALDPLTHFLLLDTAVAAPAETTTPTTVPA